MEPSSKKNRILVVDDDPMIREIITSVVTRLGNEVIMAKNGAEALRLFSLTPVDVLITDFQMPGMDGCELATSIKQITGNTPVIMVTGTKNSKIFRALANKDVDTLLLKPFLAKDLKSAIDDLLDKQCP